RVDDGVGRQMKWFGEGGDGRERFAGQERARGEQRVEQLEHLEARRARAVADRDREPAHPPGADPAALRTSRTGSACRNPAACSGVRLVEYARITSEASAYADAAPSSSAVAYRACPSWDRICHRAAGEPR